MRHMDCEGTRTSRRLAMTIFHSATSSHATCKHIAYEVRGAKYLGCVGTFPRGCHRVYHLYVFELAVFENPPTHNEALHGAPETIRKGKSHASDAGATGRGFNSTSSSWRIRRRWPIGADGNISRSSLVVIPWASSASTWFTSNASTYCSSSG